MIETPKISLVTTNYDGAAFLERTILSVLGQDYPNLEYIIIDGGSKDESVEIIRKYADRLSYWISEPDLGMYDAIQKGFNRSSGTIMGWINSDDILHPRALHRVATFFGEFPNVTWLTGTASFIDEDDNVFVPFAQEYPLWSRIRYYAFDYKWIQQESTFWRRDLWEKSGASLDTSLKYAGDLELWLRFFDYEKLYCVPILIGAFRIRSAGQKSIENQAAYEKEAKACIRKRVRRNLLLYLLAPVSYFDRILISIPLVRSFYHRSHVRSLLGYPAKVEFDGKQQKLILR